MMRSFLLILAAPLAFSAPASAAPTVVVAVGLSGARVPYKGAAYALDFANGYYRSSGQRYSSPTSFPGWSYSGSVSGTGATVRTATDKVGNVYNFANGVPRITNQGLLVEGASANQVLYARDFTQSVWAKVNITAALNQTGADLSANSASQLTATAANATALQTLTLSSQAETFSIYLKRISGTGSLIRSNPQSTLVSGGQSMAASKLDPHSLTTVKAVGGAVVEVHECLHVVDQKVDVVKVQVAMLAAANGISLPTEEEMRSGAAPRKVRRRLGGMNPYKAAAVLMPAVAGGVGLYKVIEPAVIAFFTALHHALMTAH